MDDNKEKLKLMKEIYEEKARLHRKGEAEGFMKSVRERHAGMATAYEIVAAELKSVLEEWEGEEP